MNNWLRKFISWGLEYRGATAVEYALLVGLIAVVIIVAVVALGGVLEDVFEGVGSAITKQVSGDIKFGS